MSDTNIDQIAGTPAGTVMTPEYLAAIGRFAYIWGWPLVNNLNRSLGMTSVPAPGRLGGIAPVSPAGHVSMLTDYIDAGERPRHLPQPGHRLRSRFQVAYAEKSA
jgi:hypothetical protein